MSAALAFLFLYYLRIILFSLTGLWKNNKTLSGLTGQVRFTALSSRNKSLFEMGSGRNQKRLFFHENYRNSPNQ